MTDKIVRFRELYAIPSGNGLSRPSSVRGTGYRMINMGELFAHDIIGDIEMERVQMNDKEKQKFFVEEGDLLFARQSLVAAGAGKCSIVKTISEPTTYESHLIRVRLNRQTCSPWFYYYLFRLPDNPVKSIINQCAQAGIRGSDLAKVKVPLPPLPTQRKIAKVLSAYDDLIENNTKRIRILERMIELGYKAIAGVSRLKEKEVRLSSIIQIVRGLSYSSDEIERQEGVRLINLKNINAFGGFRADGTKWYSGKYKTEQIVGCGDLVMGVTDMTQDRRTVGSVALIPTTSATSVISADLIKIESKIDKVFLYAMFRFGGVSKYIALFANGANVLHLRPQCVLKVKVQLPADEEIARYVRFARPLVAEINSCNSQNALLARQRDLLLPRLMSGKLSVEGVG